MYRTPITVVVPCFNEQRGIYTNLKKIAEYLDRHFESFEIIAINDGSSDGTLAELEKAAREIQLKVISSDHNEGKGSAVRTGFLESRKESKILMFLDADLAIPIEELPPFIKEIEEGADVAIASRFVAGSKKIKPVLWYRIIMEKVFRLMRMIILNNWNIKDTQCGFKVFRSSAARKIFPALMTRRFAFDAEIIFLARKMGFKIIELPISLQNPQQSHIRLFRDPLNMAGDLLRIRLNYATGKYKKAPYEY